MPDVAADWNPSEFLATLKAARVNSIDFAKCRHGLAYCDTRRKWAIWECRGTAEES